MSRNTNAVSLERTPAEKKRSDERKNRIFDFEKFSEVTVEAVIKKYNAVAKKKLLNNVDLEMI